MKTLHNDSGTRSRWANASYPGLLLSILACFSCGPELEPISKIQTLRIVGVKKSAPYARPGEKVQLSLLWEDGRAVPAAQVETFIAFWCLNPPSNLYSACLTTPPPPDFEPQFVFNSNRFEIDIPVDSLQPSIADPRMPDSGIAYVFYGVCAGTLSGALIEAKVPGDAMGVSGNALMPRCLDATGAEVSPDDFVVGYSSVFVYDDLRNQNPIVKGFKVAGKEVRVDCIDEECEKEFDLPQLDKCEKDVACIEACPDDGSPELCPDIKIEALINPASAEKDDLAKVAYGTDLEEAIWVSYFIDRGKVSPSVKLVNDSALGWQADFTTELFAPKEKGPLRIWAAVRDNRGGLSWVRLPAFVY